MEVTKELVQTMIKRICDETSEFLIAKNNSYGNSAINPSRIFAKSSAEEQIAARIDDKLNRIMNNQSWAGDNDLDDLIGYLILLKVVREVNASELRKAVERGQVPAFPVKPTGREVIVKREGGLEFVAGATA
jgi:hypothetical protein